jgi:Flp pilus assembly CpaF family ATPase/NAD-dependent dihydropyrimidine dehydrogenase PreA subunit
MYLKLKETPTRDVFINCYKNFTKKDLSVFNCKNCKDAPCVKACKEGAIIKQKNGIVTIDLEKCTGCLECIDACPEKAIVINKGKASKCDLCLNNSFLMPCYYANRDVLEFCEDLDHSSLQSILEKYLGYIITKEEITQVLSTDKRVIKSNEKLMYLLKYQNLSNDEIKVINEILDSYKFKTEELTISIKKDLEDELIEYCYKNNVELDNDQFLYLIDLAVNNLFEYGPLTQLLKDFNLEEISIIGINSPVFVYHRNYGWLETNLKYISEQKLKDIINKLGWFSNKYITLKNPLMDATLKDHTRLNAIISPITETVAITIRKFSEIPFTIYDLLRFRTISSKALAFLKLTFLTDANIFVVGNTGSGKTTTLNAFLEFIPKDERLVLVEEVHEINISHSHKVQTTVNKELGITMENLIINTLRMRPDKVVIGEVRTREETGALIDSLLCGQAKGTYTTFHAQSARDAVLRFVSYGVLESDVSSVDLIVTQRRYNEYTLEETNTKDRRKIFEISEINYVNNEIKINKIFEYDFEKKELVFKNYPEKLMAKFHISFGIKTKKELMDRIEKEEEKLRCYLPSIKTKEKKKNAKQI